MTNDKHEATFHGPRGDNHRDLPRDDRAHLERDEDTGEWELEFPTERGIGLDLDRDTFRDDPPDDENGAL